MTCKPIWSEGVLITQHHFQQQDRYHEQLLGERLKALAHYDWGVLELQIDQAALATRQLELLRVHAIWPDGVSVECGGASECPCPEPRSFEAALGPETRALAVYLGLARELPGQLQVNEAEGEGTRRYLAAVRTVRDSNGAAEAEVEWARPNLRLFFGDEPQHGYSTLRIAELVRDAGGNALLRDNYVPPVLRLSSAPFLLNGLHRVLSATISRQRQLASERARRQPGQIEFHATAAQRFWLLHVLNGAIPGLRHLFDTGHAHPEELYLALSSFAGQLCSFSGNLEPTSLPSFDYLALGSCFEELFARLLVQVAVEVESPYCEVQLERRSDGIYLGKLEQLGERELFVALRSSSSDALVRERAPQVLKIADWTQIYDVVKQARHALRAEVEWQPSAALPLEPGTCFLRLRKEGAFWRGIERSGTVALYLPRDAEWQGASLSLYTIDPKYLK
ncbi:MAG: protein ImpJ/VasE [Pseudomonadota bacterium]|jgi:type VI secretion system protein ImpJ